MAVVARAVIVGRLGMHQLGAVGLSNMVFFFVTVFFSFLLVVTTPRVADALAADDGEQVRLSHRGRRCHDHIQAFLPKAPQDHRKYLWGEVLGA